jgi:predicted amidophosphoribosyltransferase
MVIVLIICYECYKVMYEEHMIKCSSCGKLFKSKEDETVCDKCSKELENIK